MTEKFQQRIENDTLKTLEEKLGGFRRVSHRMRRAWWKERNA